MTKLYGYAIGVLVALLIAASAALYLSVSANGALRTERDAAVATLSRTENELKRIEGVLGRTRAERAAYARSAASAKQALKQAQDASPEWSRGNVPPAVQEALRGALTP